MSSLDPKGPIPLHAQLEEILRQRIAENIWPENSLIPSENELSQQYGLSRMTVRSVLVRLVQEGLLYRVPGKGTYVSAHKVISHPLAQMGIREQLERNGYDNKTKLISAELVPAGSRIADKMKIAPSIPVYEVCRIRYVKGHPFSLHYSYILESGCPGFLSRRFDLEGKQLCDILREAYGLDQKNMKETLEVLMATGEEVTLLDVTKNFPLLHLEDYVCDRAGRVIEYSSVLFRGDRIKIELQNTIHMD